MGWYSYMWYLKSSLQISGRTPVCKCICQLILGHLNNLYLLGYISVYVNIGWWSTRVFSDLLLLSVFLRFIKTINIFYWLIDRFLHGLLGQVENEAYSEHWLKTSCKTFSYYRLQGRSRVIMVPFSLLIDGQKEDLLFLRHYCL